MAPHTGALLLSDDGTLTLSFKAELRNRSTGPGLENYIREKNQWEQLTFEFVNWASHGKAMKARAPMRVHLTKFLHEALPTFHLLNRIDGGLRKCVGCGACDETVDHIFRCQATTREEWKLKWWGKVEAFHVEHGTHPLLRHVFREALGQWFNPESPEDVSTIRFPQEVRLLIQQQNAIGWRQIFRGRFASEWQEFRMSITFDIGGDLPLSARERDDKRLLFWSSGIPGPNCGLSEMEKFMARQGLLGHWQSEGR
jgi:hypothetical protein